MNEVIESLLKDAASSESAAGQYREDAAAHRANAIADDAEADKLDAFAAQCRAAAKVLSPPPGQFRPLLKKGTHA